MSNKRNSRVNKYGCRPDEDVCIEHDEPLVCEHGCSCAKAHVCEELQKQIDSEIVKAGVLAINRLRLGVDVSLAGFCKGLRGHELDELIELSHELWTRNEEGDRELVEKFVAEGLLSMDQVLAGAGDWEETYFGSIPKRGLRLAGWNKN